MSTKKVGPKSATRKRNKNTKSAKSAKVPEAKKNSKNHDDNNDNTSPDNTTITLMDREGGNTDNGAVLFDDEAQNAAANVNGSQPTGWLKPVGSLDVGNGAGDAHLGFWRDVHQCLRH